MDLTDLLRDAGNVDTAVGRPSLWVKACESLAAAGDFEVLRRRLPDLSISFADLGYFASMNRIVGHIPDPCDRRDVFRDDEAAAFQISTCPGSDTVMFCFCGAADRLGLNITIMHAWLSHLPVHLVYLRGYWPVHIAGSRIYAGSEPDRALRDLRDVVDRLSPRRVLCWGNSLGGFSALHYGLALGAESVLVLGTKTNLDPATNPFARASYHGHDLRDDYLRATSRPRTCLIYADQHPEDNYHARHFADVPGTELWGFPESDGHNVLIEVIVAQALPKAMAWVMASGGSRAQEMAA